MIINPECRCGHPMRWHRKATRSADCLALRCPCQGYHAVSGAPSRAKYADAAKAKSGVS